MLFHDWMYPSRMYFIDKLVGMGARIILCDPHRAIIVGGNRLAGAKAVGDYSIYPAGRTALRWSRSTTACGVPLGA